MSVGNWDPGAAVSSIDTAELRQFIALAENDQLDDLKTQLKPAQITAQAGLMQIPAEQWPPVLAEFTSTELIHLLKFFTLAEMQLPGWEGEEHSPVIWINRYLRKQGQALSKADLQWIREHSSNRFLPNGAIF